MKCNICGGEITEGQKTCKYCGNVMSVPTPKKEITEKKQTDIKMPPQYAYTERTSVDTHIYQQDRSKGGYCVKCGRPLDGVTHKCIVCDAAQVSRRAYNNADFKKREMNIMAQKKKKNKKNKTIRNAVLAILAMIVIFSLAACGAIKLSNKLGIGSAQNDDTTSFNVTSEPKVTADPNWKADVSDEEKETVDEDEDNKTEDKNVKATETPAPTQKETIAPARTPEPVETGDPVELRGGEYLYPSDTHLISEGELEELSRENIKYIYWEIYARHGYTFDDNLADYFENNHEWYMPITSDKSKVEAQFNDIEKRNIKTIEAYQKEKGWR